MSTYSEFLLIQSAKCPCCERHMIIGEDEQYLCKSCDISVPVPEKTGMSVHTAWMLVFLYCAFVWFVVGEIIHHIH